jgi:cyclopropane-fatty-acyl-phospholipid synthase
MQDVVTPLVLPVVERNMIPDVIVRTGIRRELEMELLKVSSLSVEEKATKVREFVAELKTLPIAVSTKSANDQHYEVPDEFFQLLLGPKMKYSSGYWPSANTTLPESETHMLDLYCERAGITDGMSIIDLGCGWGSLTLYVAERYPNCKITGISNSNSQREYILTTAKERGLNNVNVVTGDINTFDLPEDQYNGKLPPHFSAILHAGVLPLVLVLHSAVMTLSHRLLLCVAGCADRVVSIEMFEHMKNYHLLMQKISRWVKPGGKVRVCFIAEVKTLAIAVSLGDDYVITRESVLCERRTMVIAQRSL